MILENYSKENVAFNFKAESVCARIIGYYHMNFLV